MGFFREAADVAVTGPDQRKISDLSLLAMARVSYEQGRLPEAAGFYGQVGGDSPYLADKLYEVVWTSIKQEQFTSALDAVEIFLLRFPEHEYTAQMRLLEAHLRLEQRDWDEALGAYEQVVTDYTPVREQFGELARGTDEQDWFRMILAASDGDASDAGGLPGYAVAMMVGDPGMARALDVFREIDRQEEQIAASEALILELREVMGTAAGIGGHDRLRYEVGVERGRALDAQVGLLAFEEAWLAESLPLERLRELDGPAKMRDEVVGMIERMPDDIGSEESIAARREHLEALEALQREVDQLEANVEQKEQALAATSPRTREELAARTELTEAQKAHSDAATRLEAMRAEGPSTAWSERLSEQEKVVAVSIDEARRAYQPLRQGVPDPQGSLARVDRLQTTLASDQERLSALRTKLVAAEADELARIRTRFDHEVREVESQRADLGDTMGEAEEVSTALTRHGFGRLEDFFAESVVRADMGVVDVYWSHKVDLADQRERMAAEKKQMVQALEDRFDRIREKLEPAEEP